MFFELENKMSWTSLVALFGIIEQLKTREKWAESLKSVYCQRSNHLLREFSVTLLQIYDDHCVLLGSKRFQLLHILIFVLLRLLGIHRVAVSTSLFIYY